MNGDEKNGSFAEYEDRILEASTLKFGSSDIFTRTLYEGVDVSDDFPDLLKISGHLERSQSLALLSYKFSLVFIILISIGQYSVAGKISFGLLRFDDISGLRELLLLPYSVALTLAFCFEARAMQYKSIIRFVLMKRYRIQDWVARFDEWIGTVDPMFGVKEANFFQAVTSRRFATFVFLHHLFMIVFLTLMVAYTYVIFGSILSVYSNDDLGMGTKLVVLLPLLLVHLAIFLAVAFDHDEDVIVKEIQDDLRATLEKSGTPAFEARLAQIQNATFLLRERQPKPLDDRM